MIAQGSSIKIFKLVLLALLTASLLCNSLVLWGKRSYMAQGYFDFIIYYTGAEIINAGKGNQLYDLEVQEAYQEKFKIPHQPWYVLPFNHAPYELLLFLPLATLSFQAAHAWWSLFSVILLIFAWRLMVRYIDFIHKYLCAGLLAAFYPTMTTLQMGQDSALSLLILTGVFVAMKQGQQFVAGGILALGLYKPQLVLPLAGIVCVSGYRRMVLGFIASAGILALISIVMVGWQGAIGLLKIISTMQGPTSIVYPESMTNLRGLSFLILESLNRTTLTNAVTVIATVAIYGCCLWAWKSKNTLNSAGFDLQYAFAIVTTVLTSYHLYTHDGIILMIPVVLLLNNTLSTKTVPAGVRFCMLAVILVLFTPYVPFLLTIRGGFGWGVVPVLIMFGLIGYEIVLETNKQSSHAIVNL